MVYGWMKQSRYSDGLIDEPTHYFSLFAFSGWLLSGFLTLFFGLHLVLVFRSSPEKEYSNSFLFHVHCHCNELNGVYIPYALCCRDRSITLHMQRLVHRTPFGPIQFIGYFTKYWMLTFTLKQMANTYRLLFGSREHCRINRSDGAAWIKSAQANCSCNWSHHQCQFIQRLIHHHHLRRCFRRRCRHEASYTDK